MNPPQPPPLRFLSVLALTLLGASSLLAADPLPSWNESPTKTSLLDFVAAVTTEGTPGFVPPEERVAVFDNDGTLCAEQPMYFQFAFGVDQVRARADEHPGWAATQPFKAALENDIDGLGKSELQGLTELVAGSYAGRSVEELEQGINRWLATARHPTLERPYPELVYQPMLELLRYLRANGFKTYIVTGSTVEFLRAWAPRVYGVLPEQIIGSNLQTAVETRGRATVIKIADGVFFANNKANKALSIERVIGRRPIFAIGNSDGDLDMLRLTATESRPHWTGLVHHTDAEREFAYDRQTYFGRLIEGLADAQENNWWIVDMKEDWKTIFPAPAESEGGVKRF